MNEPFTLDLGFSFHWMLLPFKILILIPASDLYIFLLHNFFPSFQRLQHHKKIFYMYKTRKTKWKWIFNVRWKLFEIVSFFIRNKNLRSLAQWLIFGLCFSQYNIILNQTHYCSLTSNFRWISFISVYNIYCFYIYVFMHYHFRQYEYNVYVFLDITHVRIHYFFIYIFFSSSFL